jgi:5'/3'-nucleotidase
MPHILITNDDGCQAPALAALAGALAGLGRVTVFAPDHNWSAAGHTKTMHKPLRITESSLPDGTPMFVTSGSPSDCVGLALLGVASEPLDLVISGINKGSNLGHDITYSGTVAAAMEAAVYGVPAVAASQDDSGEAQGDLEFAVEVVFGLARRVLAQRLPRNTFLNVNFPALPRAQVRGIQVTRLGTRVYRDVLIRRLDPKGRPYYWIGGDPPGGEPEDGTDIGALAGGYVSVTPLNLDMTDTGLMARLSDWCHEL